MYDLNREQYKASLPDEGINLVLAGAGTGKTRTLVEKVKNIINSSLCRDNEILILTFSRKAAIEIKERVKDSIGSRASGINSGTFHSFCLSFLKENSEVFIKRFSFGHFPAVIDESIRNRIYSEILEKKINALKGLPMSIAFDFINNFDNLNKQAVESLKRSGMIEVFNEIREEYGSKKRSLNMIDFTDMIGFTIEMLKKDHNIRMKTMGRYKYILVDEFQDTSDDNFELLKQILPKVNPNLFAVGDDWQSIYGFRMARIEYIVNIRKYFPSAKIHRLKINYRSRREIVRLSNRFIKRNRIRTRKSLRSFKGRGGTLRFYSAADFNEETDIIHTILSEEEKTASHVAVLYRNNWQGDYIMNNIDIPLHGLNNVEFLTMHSSKGLEFDAVIIAGVSDMIIPERTSGLEEERRLFYVALTRARERLYIISHENDDGTPAKFMSELKSSFYSF